MTEAVPHRKGRWGWVLACAVTVALTAGCGGAEPVTSDQPVAAKGAFTPIGETGRDGAFEFSVTRVERSKPYAGERPHGVAPQGEFVFVWVTAKNVGDQPRTLSGADQKLVLADGSAYAAHVRAAAHLPDNRAIHEEIQPGAEVVGVVVFDIPVAAALDRVELHESAGSDGVRVSLEIMSGWN